MNRNVNLIVNLLYNICEKIFVFINSFFEEKGVILMFHHVTDEALDVDPTCIHTISRFREIIDDVRKNFIVIPLPDVYSHMSNNGKFAVITFDDATMDFYSNAYPILSEYNIPFTLYVATNFLGKAGYISQQELLILSRDDKVTLGYHTADHVFLSKTKNKRYQIIDSKIDLEKIVKFPIEYFAYPYGKLSSIGFKSILVTLKSTYKNAVGTVDCPLTPFSLRFKYYLPRVVIK